MNLDSPISDLPHVGPYYQKKLEKLKISKVRDLFYLVPHRYLDYSKITPIAKSQIGEILTLKGELVFLKNQYTKSGKKIQLAEIKDQSGKIMVVWFNQPYLTRTLFPGDKLSLSGKIEWFGREKAVIGPEYEKGEAGLYTGRLVPVYPETAGLSSKWLRHRLYEVSQNLLPGLKDPLPNQLLEKYQLVKLPQAIQALHFPSNLREVEKARQRLAFEELLNLHLISEIKKINWHQNSLAQKLAVDKKAVREFIDSLPFKLTISQIKCVNEILVDLEKDLPMNRLLEGDVGAGKTIVAAVAIFVSFLNGQQSVVMAPTQILAQQHFITLKRVFDHYKVRIALITSAELKSDLGTADLIIGTHALLHKKASFANTALVVIDEQHKFGVEQRDHLIRKTKSKRIAPHVLTMTATPIPRSVALTLYGDMELSILDEMPPGRLKVTTWIIPPQKRVKAYQWLKEKLVKEKIQAFVVCPLIDESDSLLLTNIKAVTSEYKKLVKIFKQHKLGLLHGRLKTKEKNEVVAKFRQQTIDILVSTPVIEVGLDIAKANIILIEAAERFGLAQLHQLRGRVGRGEQKAYCLLFSSSSSRKVSERLGALQKAQSGFELAETDLKLRGPGEIFGTRQHGFPELKVASWQDINLIKASKQAAQEIINNPHSTLATNLANKLKYTI